MWFLLLDSFPWNDTWAGSPVETCSEKADKSAENKLMNSIDRPQRWDQTEIKLSLSLSDSGNKDHLPSLEAGRAPQPETEHSSRVFCRVLHKTWS